MNIEKIKSFLKPSKGFNHDWKDIKLSKHFLERFSERHSSKFSNEELKELLSKESDSWEFLVKDREGVEFWHRHKTQCYLYDTKNKTLVTTYVLDFNGFENDFGKSMISKMFEEFENLKKMNNDEISLIDNNIIEKNTELEMLEHELESITKKVNVLREELSNDISNKEILTDEIDKFGFYIAKNRNYQTFKLVSKYK